MFPDKKVWFIEQLPNQGGYRIYQSYNGAYSLKAWLATDVDTMTATGDIKVFYKVKNATNDLIKALSGKLNKEPKSSNNILFLIKIQLLGGTLDINSDLTMSPIFPEDVKPFINYVKNYELSDAVGVFKLAWESYGKGQVA